MTTTPKEPIAKPLPEFYKKQSINTAIETTHQYLTSMTFFATFRLQISQETTTLHYMEQTLKQTRSPLGWRQNQEKSSRQEKVGLWPMDELIHHPRQYEFTYS